MSVSGVVRRAVVFPLVRLKRRSLKFVFFSGLLAQAIIVLLVLYRNGNDDLSSSSSSTPSFRDKFNEFAAPVMNMLPAAAQQLQQKPVSKLTQAKQLYKKLTFDSSPDWIDEYTLQNSLLTLSTGPNRSQRLSSIDDLEFYDSDPRLSWSVYMHYLTNVTMAADTEDDSIDTNNRKSFVMPFSWYDWADFHNFNKLVSVREKFKQNLTCDLVLQPTFEINLLRAVEKDIGEQLFLTDREKYDDRFWYRAKSKERHPLKYAKKFCKMHEKYESTKFNLPCVVTKLEGSLRPEVYQIHARSYILNSMDHPLSVTFLEGANNSYRVYAQQNLRENMAESGLLHKFVKENTDEESPDNDIVFDHISYYVKFLESDRAAKFRVEIPGLATENYDKYKVDLTADDFIFDPKAKIKQLESQERLDRHESHYLDSLKNSILTHSALCPKYFNEATELKGPRGHHRDERFYNGARLEDPLLNNARMNSLIRTFQKFTKSTGLISWLSHGTLYGQMYNGICFPWDDDFDLQMPIKHLNLLAQYFNQSLILEDPREGNGRYLVDVGSSITTRTKANGKNNIDARFIDVDSGLYIDITGLSVSTEFYNKGLNDIIDKYDMYSAYNEVMKMDPSDIHNPDIGEGLAALNATALRDYVLANKKEFDDWKVDGAKELAEEEKKISWSDYPISTFDPGKRFEFNKKLNLVNCRNKHFDTINMISPLYSTYYHGVQAFVPHKLIYSLRNEYGVPDKYGFLTYAGHVFVPKFKAWIPFQYLKKAANINNGYSTLLSLSSPVNRLEFPDVRKIFHNIVIAGYKDLLSYLVTTFEVSTFRVKELEIQYDPLLDPDRREEALTFLRHEFGPKLTSPVKDALLYEYELKKWKEFKKNFSEEQLKEIEESTSWEILDEITKKYTIFHSRHWFKNQMDPLASPDYDIDTLGLDLYEEVDENGGSIFKEEPPDIQGAEKARLKFKNEARKNEMALIDEEEKKRKEEIRKKKEAEKKAKEEEEKRIIEERQKEEAKRKAEREKKAKAEEEERKKTEEAKKKLDEDKKKFEEEKKKAAETNNDSQDQGGKPKEENNTKSSEEVNKSKDGKSDGSVPNEDTKQSEDQKDSKDTKSEQTEKKEGQNDTKDKDTKPEQTHQEESGKDTKDPKSGQAQQKEDQKDPKDSKSDQAQQNEDQKKSTNTNDDSSKQP
ncbi:Mnn14p KNAG_0B00240 [Huiozyma naganishii CBS 8797]|uniref:LicD/FKTN/FKRP nucleotidyltransferase domain-containing protein n=1 Tax=Huiozyma naganishii (strain ATCC MYA-139 / BCRC 22969 / CBS 8797 / KCTC 17520 / NBRC 10181 / NCYC 3082 / Yp74L-3) TaxID=1071383 RepID=J7RG27_HUIN7|nr:hypothetical protein KNAG_0B00240 [Kazachstania naganishii CBS 8797]CCK68473.1 hypothetical protein KNAG_0B00240 [Kazachstania naganishii CBS 8797]